MHILIADDDQANRELLTELLHNGGHSVTAVRNGTEALAAVAKGGYEVVLMDEQMPDMNGLEATRAILQRTAAGEKRPIIVGISGNGTKEDEERCLAAGMDAFVAKPVRAAELFSVLAVLARREPIAEALPASSDTDLATGDLAALLRRATGGDEKITRSLVKTFLADAPKKLSILRRAVARGDARTIATTAHQLKGSLGLVGALRAAGTARNLQAMGRLSSLDGAAMEFRILEKEFELLRRELRALHPKAGRKAASKSVTKSASKFGARSKSKSKSRHTAPRARRRR
jgi:two-component system, sensor histidine kinase and response regulator